jgi:hypothetical protein
MAPLAILLLVVLVLSVLDLAALRWGADSRPTLSDDHVR